MHEPIKRQIRTPEEIHKQRLEKKLIRKGIPEQQREGIIKILRIRKGLLSEEELEGVKSQVISDDNPFMELHLTDINYLKSILSGNWRTRFNGLNSNSLSDLNELFLPHHDEGMSGATRVYNQSLHFYFDHADIRFKTKFDYIKYFFDNASKKGLVRYKNKEYSYMDLLSSKISDSIFTNDFLQFRNMYSDELSYILKYLRQYKLGKVEFLQNQEVLDKLHEYLARLFARSQYYTFDTNTNKVGSAMHIGLILERTATNKNLLGYFCPNEKNLPELLHIMFSFAKSIDDIVPVYGNQGKLLWPK